MKFIDLMMEEHKNIKKLNLIMRKLCLEVLEDKDFDINDFYIFIDIVREYADKHHHGKEEKFYFNEMEKNLGELGVNLIRHGMLVEHDLGRLYIMNLETALNKYRESKENETKLDIIANTISYGDLLNRHIDKEDQLVYIYGEKNLKKELLDEIDNKCCIYEEENKDIAIKYKEMLKNLENKYL